MYKVYVNGVPVFLGTPETTGELGFLPSKEIFSAPYLGKRRQIKQYLDLLDKNKNVQAVVLYAEDAERLWEDFKSCFPRLIEAAGGFVENSDKELLVFHRRDFWDMPKGKIDPGETPEIAALREVREETGLQDVQLGPFIGHTWHTYRDKNEDRVLKKTWWYHMQSGDRNATPQTEEDIERIEWVQPREWLAGKPVVYGSIRDVIEAGLSER